MKRIAIVLEKNLTAGQTANVSGILMGQAALLVPELYDLSPVFDCDGQMHAAIMYSTVILSAGAGQLLNLCKNVGGSNPNISCISFSQIGQGLHNKYDEYKTLISSAATDITKPVGVILVGDDEEIRILTRKYSLFR